MKRVTYMSRFSSTLSDADVRAIGEHAQVRNAQDQVTGVLLCIGNAFFQIIEGDDAAIDDLFARVRRDARHTDVFCLQTELHVTERLFPAWSMNTIDLTEATDDVLRPIKLLLDRLGDAHHVIGRYTQPAVSRILAAGLDPLHTPLREATHVVLFADMVAFSAISERLRIEDVSELVGCYLEICSSCVVRRGGEVNKYLGDGLMAYFDAQGADDAIAACLDALGALAAERDLAGPQSPRGLLHSGFGLARGVVLEGTVGASVKMDYTIIGEAVNTAARLEALTRRVGTPLVLATGVKEHSVGPWEFRHLGSFELGASRQRTDAYGVLAPLTAPVDLRAAVLGPLGAMTASR